MELDYDQDEDFYNNSNNDNDDDHDDDCSVLIIHVPNMLIIDNNLSMGSKVSTLYLIQ